MIKEEAPNPVQQLQLIDSMINKARNFFSENGHLYLLWGWTILICSIGNYILEFIYKKPYGGIVWMLTWAVLIYQLFYIRSKRKKLLVQTYTHELVKYVWMVFVILMLLTFLIVGRLSNTPHATDAMCLVLYGMPTILSGIILKFKPLVTGGLICWLLVILSVFIPVEYHLLLIAVAVIAAWIVPGYILQSLYRRQNSGKL